MCDTGLMINERELIYADGSQRQIEFNIKTQQYKLVDGRDFRDFYSGGNFPGCFVMLNRNRMWIRGDEKTIVNGVNNLRSKLNDRRELVRVVNPGVENGN